MKTTKMIFNGVILDLALGPRETDRDGSAWRCGTVSFDASTVACGGGWIESEESANQKNEEAGIAGGLRQGVSYPNETIGGDFSPYAYGEDESGWQESVMRRICGDQWEEMEDADDMAREVYAAIQTELAKLAETRYAIIADDKCGPAYGVGATEEEARADARASGFGDGIAIEITERSYNDIVAGNPDAVEEI
jgi:hypothetical protein